MLDLFNRKVVGRSISDTLAASIVTDALKMAFDREGNHAGIVFHLNCGIQYTSDKFRNLLEGKKALPSMSRQGKLRRQRVCWDFLFKALKSKLIYREKFKTKEELRSAIFEYIETWYNRKCLHSSLGYLSPLEYESRINQAV